MSPRLAWLAFIDASVSTFHARVGQQYPARTRDREYLPPENSKCPFAFVERSCPSAYVALTWLTWIAGDLILLAV